MSFFGVTIEKIKSIEPIENADKIEKATLFGLGFYFVVPKNIYSVGQNIIYFPIDSIIPDVVLDKIGLKGKLSGPNKNRVKTIKLKSVLSQGIVTSIETLFPNQIFEIGTDVTEMLGVIKYEPPEVVCKAGRLYPLPTGVSVYDIEGCERHSNVVDELMDEPVFISEKVEGSNSAILLNRDEPMKYLQRRFEVRADPNTEEIHDWIRVPQDNGLTMIAEQILNDYSAHQVIIRSEMAGPSIQGNIYKLPKLTTFTFDIQVNGRYLDAQEFIDVCSKYNIRTAPFISVGKTLREWLAGKSVVEASYGKSLIYDTLREGIVIKPMSERYSELLKGRMFIKQRDPIYLDKTGH